MSSVFESDPVIEAYKKDINRTLLRERLKRTVEDRIRDLMRLQRFAEEMRRAGRVIVDVEAVTRVGPDGSFPDS